MLETLACLKSNIFSVFGDNRENSGINVWPTSGANYIATSNYKNWELIFSPVTCMTCMQCWWGRGGWGDGEGGVGGGGGEVVGGWGRQQQTRQRVPCFNVLRYNREVFNCFAAKQCWVQPFFEICLPMHKCNFIPGSLSDSLWLSLAPSGSLRLALALIALRMCLKIPFGSQTLPTDWFGRVKMDQWGHGRQWDHGRLWGKR